MSYHCSSKKDKRQNKMEKRMRNSYNTSTGKDINDTGCRKNMRGEYNRVGKLWTVTITPSRPNGRIGKINRGGSRGRYSKDVGRVRQPCIKWDKHEVRLCVCRKKPSGVWLAMGGIFGLLSNVVRFHTLPHPDRII